MIQRLSEQHMPKLHMLHTSGLYLKYIANKTSFFANHANFTDPIAATLAQEDLSLLLASCPKDHCLARTWAVMHCRAKLPQTGDSHIFPSDSHSLRCGGGGRGSSGGAAGREEASQLQPSSRSISRAGPRPEADRAAAAPG